MGVFDWMCLVLATGALLDAWRNGKIFARHRVHVEQACAQPRNSVESFFAELLDCAFCLSYHVPYVLLSVCALCGWLVPGWQVVPWTLIYGLAATRASNLVNELLPGRLRYHKPIELP